MAQGQFIRKLQKHHPGPHVPMAVLIPGQLQVPRLTPVLGYIVQILGIVACPLSWPVFGLLGSRFFNLMTAASVFGLVGNVVRCPARNSATQLSCHSPALAAGPWLHSSQHSLQCPPVLRRYAHRFSNPPQGVTMYLG